MEIDQSAKPGDLRRDVDRVLELACDKVRSLDRSWNPKRGAPVYTVRGKYTTRGWTEWTEGFRYGIAILAFDGTGEKPMLEIGRQHTIERMAYHVTHVGVHDHGFNNLSTYGNLRRLMREGRIRHDGWEKAYYELAIKASGAVQAARWAPADAEGPENGRFGYMYTFNGPHSLFIDTIRTTRILDVAHQLGHHLCGEHDEVISLLGRSIFHNLTTAYHNVYYGEGRDSYDAPEKRGRTVHECIFNRNDGRFRCPSSQQGYSPRSTWTRGLSWAVVGFPEQLEFLQAVPANEVKRACGLNKSEVVRIYEEAARAAADFYIDQAAARDGICYWDTGAPGLAELGDWRARDAEPDNDHEPVDATASAIAAQGLIRLGLYLGTSKGARYRQAGLTIARRLFDEPYLSTKKTHQGLLLHSIYHRPNGWDHVPPGKKVPQGESSMWGDYHMMELAILVQRLADDGPYLTFFDQPPEDEE